MRLNIERQQQITSMLLDVNNFNLHLFFFVIKLFTLEFKLEHQITEVIESNKLTVRLLLLLLI